MVLFVSTFVTCNYIRGKIAVIFWRIILSIQLVNKYHCSNIVIYELANMKTIKEAQPKTKPLLQTGNRISKSGMVYTSQPTASVQNTHRFSKMTETIIESSMGKRKHLFISYQNAKHFYFLACTAIAGQKISLTS